MVKYGLWRLKSNQIGLQTNLNQSVKNFYNDSSTWCSSGTYNTSAKFQDTKITLTTDYLNGAPSDIYRFNVHVGVELQ